SDISTLSPPTSPLSLTTLFRSPLDATASGFIKGGTNLQTSSFSTTSASEVLVAGMMSGSSCAPAPAPGSGYTMEISAVPSGCVRSEEHTSELQSRGHLVCRLLL